MPKRIALDADATELTLWGHRADDRFDDEQIAAVADRPIRHATFYRQSLTRLPRLPQLEKLTLGAMPGLASLDGIEELVHLRELTLHSLPGLDLARVLAQLAELPELVEVDLGGDALTELPVAIAKLPSLLNLQLTDCPKLDFERAFARIGAAPSVRVLRLIQRSRPRLPDAFSPLVSVRRLELLFYMKFLPPSIGDMASLEELIGERNYFEALPASFGKLKRLRVLDLGGSRLKRVPDEICECTALERLDLYGTRITALPAAIGTLANLRVLRIPDSVAELPPGGYELKLFELLACDAIRDKLPLIPAPPPEDERLSLTDPDRIPSDLGQPRRIWLHVEKLASPLAQLAKLTRLEELDAWTETLELVVPYIPESVRKLELRGVGATLPDLAHVAATSLSVTGEMTDVSSVLAMTTLTSLSIESDRLASLPDDLGELVELTSLHVRCAARELPASLSRCTALVHLDVSGAWNTWEPFGSYQLLLSLSGLRQCSLSWFTLDGARLFDALAHTRVEDVALSSVKLDAVPAELARCVTLRRFGFGTGRLEPAKVKAKLPPGRWKKRETRSWTTYERTD